jgi:hypothetical protein
MEYVIENSSKKKKYLLSSLMLDLGEISIYCVSDELNILKYDRVLVNLTISENY